MNRFNMTKQEMKDTMLDFETMFTVKTTEDSIVGVYPSRITAERAALRYEQDTLNMTRIAEGSIDRPQSLWDAEMYNSTTPTINDTAFVMFSKLPVVSL